MQAVFLEQLYTNYLTEEIKQLTKKHVMMKYLKEKLDTIESLCLRDEVCLDFLLDNQDSDFFEIEYGIQELLEICYLEPFVTHIYYGDHRDSPSWFQKEVDILIISFKTYFRERLKELDLNKYEQLKKVEESSERSRKRETDIDKFEKLLSKAHSCDYDDNFLRCYSF